ncbi:phage holin family protein [Methylobacterium sp.]|uniref:phage holin family protein n=1 Tax=Methylobacterium sp. TaxID=409 RepID=UPI003C77A183
MIKPRPRTVQSHLGDAIRETRELVSSKIVLFRAEMTSSLHHLTWALSLFIAAGVFAMAGVAVLILALVKGLAVLLHSEALSALVIGGVFAAIAISLALWGRSKASPSGLEPIRPEQQVGQNVALITERISG